MQKAAKTIARILLACFTALVALLLFSVLFVAIAEGVTEEFSYIPPSEEKKDIRAVLEKEMWTNEDIDLLYHQTGLTRVGLIALKGDTERILEFQEARYLDWVIGHQMAAFTTPHDYLLGYRKEGSRSLVYSLVPIVPLEDGDVLVSASCHTFGWRNGHAAIVLDGETGIVLESVGPGYTSSPGSAAWFREASDFMVLRLKDKTKSERREIAVYAGNHLMNIDYSILTGIFSPKDQGEAPATTHCSHLVWQAFKYFGYDIDSDGGPVCTTRDIANSDLFEIVQVFGFDLDKLW